RNPNLQTCSHLPRWLQPSAQRSQDNAHIYMTDYMGLHNSYRHVDLFNPSIIPEAYGEGQQCVVNSDRDSCPNCQNSEEEGGDDGSLK
ncbi:hypothetical protein KUCAC02_000711, partial [Chaenocephalus aceratus]